MNDFPSPGSKPSRVRMIDPANAPDFRLTPGRLLQSGWKLQKLAGKVCLISPTGETIDRDDIFFLERTGKKQIVQPTVLWS